MARLLPNCKSYIITSPYGMRVHPVSGQNKMHNGIDIVGTNGSGGMADYILAHTGGTVESAGYDSSAGYYINIRVSSRTVMAYYHLRETPYFKKGATVKAGEKIGYMGASGAVTGVHLHWGIKRDGAWIDPEPFLSADYSDGSATSSSSTNTSASTSTSTKGGNTVMIEMKVLTKGSKGEQVKTLQRLLLAMGYNLGGYGVDGSFGGATYNAVKVFQKEKGLSVDGSVGSATWNKLLKG